MFDFHKEDDLKVGEYLKKLICRKYPNVRQFCIAYLKKSGIKSPGDDEIARMQNRMSQIINGNKALRTYDLPIFCELLDVSCEQILSAGKCYAPSSGHMTNYDIAFSKDKEEWTRYLEREDKLFLNPDEYNKTVIDYAIEFKNYDFLKFLMENKYIWFIDDSKDGGCFDKSLGFGAGTSIKRRESVRQDSLDYDLKFHSEERGLRQKVIALAMENGDFDTMTELRAREVPALYAACCYIDPPVKSKDYYEEDVIEEIVKSADKVLGYFSEDFTICDRFGYKHRFIYPYMPQILEKLIKNKSKYAEVLLRRSIEHNKKVFGKLSEMFAEAFEVQKSFYDRGDSYKPQAEVIVQDAMNHFYFYDDGFLYYTFSKARGKNPKFCANVVRVNAGSDDLLIDSLIRELNSSYEAVRDIRPDISNY